MIVLRIEHRVNDFDGWKKAFDSDPLNRKKSGVLGHRIFRPIDNLNYVIIDLEFENINDAESVLLALHKLWGNVDGKIIFNPQTRILNLVENNNY